MLGKFGITELILVLTIALLVFGPSKLPQVGKSIGLAISEFKNGAKKIADDVSIDDADEKKN